MEGADVGDRRGERETLRVLEEHGWAGRLVPAERRFDLWEEIEGRVRSGEVDRELFETYLSGFEAGLGEAPEWARSILIVAGAVPAIRIRFGWQGREVGVTVPPSYLPGAEWIDRVIERVLCERGADDGAGSGDETQFATANVPRKLLAARSGLARYGRNNVSYIEGMGSYYRLVAFYGSIPVDEDVWHEPEMLASCQSCRLCLDACPTGAIGEDRFLLHAEKCLTYWNEKPTDVPFPERTDPGLHELLIGCLRCQTVCPHNRGLLQVEEAETAFTEEETEGLLGFASDDTLPAPTVEKLERLDLHWYLEVLPRNLRAAFDAAASKG